MGSSLQRPKLRLAGISFAGAKLAMSAPFERAVSPVCKERKVLLSLPDHDSRVLSCSQTVSDGPRDRLTGIGKICHHLIESLQRIR
jgi:hypothetical protein